MLTYTGQYAFSTNGGSGWRVEQMPSPGGEKKNPALAVDLSGNAHVVDALKVRSPEEVKSGQPPGAYYQLRYVRRQEQGGWLDPHDVLAAFAEWRNQGTSWDSIADWPDIAVDTKGNLHVGFSRRSPRKRECRVAGSVKNHGSGQRVGETRPLPWTGSGRE